MKGDLNKMTHYNPEQVADFVKAFYEFTQQLGAESMRKYVKKEEPVEVRRIMFDNSTYEARRKYESIVPGEVATHLNSTLEQIIQSIIAPETRPTMDD